MLDPAFVRDHGEEVRAGLRNRGLDPDAVLGPFAELDARRKALILQVEGLKHEQNAAAEKVAKAKKEGLDPSSIFAANKARGQQIKELEAQLDEGERQRTDLMMTVPNLPPASGPQGKSADATNDVRRHGAQPPADAQR